MNMFGNKNQGDEDKCLPIDLIASKMLHYTDVVLSK